MFCLITMKCHYILQFIEIYIRQNILMIGRWATSRAEGLLDIIDFKDDDVYKAVYNEVVKWQMAVINTLLSHLKTDVNVKTLKGNPHYIVPLMGNMNVPLS